MRIITLVAVLASLGAETIAAQNLVSNGDFETGPFDAPATVPSWTVSGNGHVSEVPEGATSGSYGAALSIGTDSQGNVLSQTINTVAGQSYILEFDSGVSGMPTGTLQLHFQVFGNISDLDETVVPPVANTFTPSQVEFHHYFRPFVADGTTTTIRFTDVGLGNAGADILVDTVSVIVAPPPTPAPTPTTLPLVNGDFETWPFNDGGTVAGWTVGGNQHVEAITQGATSGTHSAGFSVGSDSSNDTLSQTFVTSANQTYTLDFDAGVFGQRSGAPLQLQAQIFGTGSLLSIVITPPDAFTYHPSQVTFQHYHYSFVADGSLATVQFTDLTGDNADADVMLDTVSILPQVPTFAEWQSSNFTAAELNDPTISDWTADPDYDGIPNGLEYFFHTNPTAGVPLEDQPLLPQTGSSSDGTSTYLTFTYHRLLGWTGNAPVVAISNDLVNWDTTQSQIEQIGSPARADGFTDVVTVRLKTPIGQGAFSPTFFRLMLTQ